MTATAQTDSLTVFEVDHATQDVHPITFGRVFKQGEIAAGKCPRPVVDGRPVASGSWQADVKNAWPADRSVRFAIVSLNQTLAPSQAAVITFEPADCSGSGFLTHAQMMDFNSGRWEAQIVVTPSTGSAVTVSAKSMLSRSDPGANIFGGCRNGYWLKGPVVTAVIVQDCTSASASDFGWLWNGTTMGEAATGNAPTASLHPMFILSFYPAIHAVKVESILENPWIGRQQDQDISVSIKIGAIPAQMWSNTNSRFFFGARLRKTFWSMPDGSASDSGPGHIRLDHNWAYLKSTLAFPNYDPNVTVSAGTNDPANGATSWDAWSRTDKGEFGGFGGFSAWTKGYGNNDEGAPLQREELLYLYNMGSCGKANSECAKAWQMLTGESGLIDNKLNSGKVIGGGGAWNNLGNVNFHLRESRTSANGAQPASTNWFYCPVFADKDTTVDSTDCGSGAGDATGKVLSRHAHSTIVYGGPGNSVVKPVGNSISSGWSIGGCNHWLDYAYTPYLLTGSYYFLENEYQSAALCITSKNSDPLSSAGGARFFGFINHDGNVTREWAWGMQTLGRAAFIAPDGTPESAYFHSMVDSNLEIQEGLMGITGTPLTPSDTSCAAATCDFNSATANRWNWGRALAASGCIAPGKCVTIPMPLHAFSQGRCDTAGKDKYLNYAVTDSYVQAWQNNWVSIVLSEMREMGFTHATAISSEMHKGLVEMLLDKSFNPYLTAQNIQPVHDVAAGRGCTEKQARSLNPMLGTYERMLSAYKTTPPSRSLPGQASFDDFSSSPHYSGNPNYKSFPCQSHSYADSVRAAGSFLQYFAASSKDPNCPNGECTASAAWAWLRAEVPYFGSKLSHNGKSAVSTMCTDLRFKGHYTDQQIKFALAPR